MASSQAKLSAKQMKEWDEDKLLTWIQQELPRPLKDDTIQKFKDAEILGRAFLMLANNDEFFNQTFGLSLGLSLVLAGLAREALVMVQKGEEQDTSAGKSTDHAPLLFPFISIATEHTTKRKGPPHIDIAPPPKRTRVGVSSLIINGGLKYFRSGAMSFSALLRTEGQAYFDRTRYIFVLQELDKFILFCRPRRFGKSFTVSMLEHFHGLQYAGEHQSLYKVCNNIPHCLHMRSYFSFNHSRISMCKKISTKEG
jgi:hypothetical protein